MAADTRPSTPSHGPPRQASHSSESNFENFNVSVAEESSNGLSHVTSQRAQVDSEHPSLSKAFMTVKLEDFKTFHRRPCVRDALLTGIVVGFSLGGVRASMGAPILRACSWAVGSFCFGSGMMFEFCQRKRRLESQALKRVVDVMDRKRAQKPTKSGENKATSVSEN